MLRSSIYPRLVELLIKKYSQLIRESEGTFQYGNYRREAEDLRAVVKHFQGEKQCIVAIIGHSKGVLDISLQTELFGFFPPFLFLDFVFFFSFFNFHEAGL